MKLKKLVLSVKRGVFRMDDPSREHADKSFQKISKDIRKRDKNTCQFCGFVSAKWQEVHHINDQHDDNSEDNLITACPLCHMAHHIGYAGLKKMGVLIYLDPKLRLTQADVNQLVRSFWIALETGNTSSKQLAETMLEELSAKAGDAETLLGCCDPLALADYLMGLDDVEYEARSEKLKGIYFLPHKDSFRKPLDYWISDIQKKNPSSKWAKYSHAKISNWLKNDDKTVDLEGVDAFIKAM